MKSWGEIVFGAFIGGCVTAGIWLLQRFATRTRDKLEMDNLYLDAQLKLEEFKREKMAELEQEADELKDAIREMTQRYKENIDHFLLQIQEQGTLIITLQQELEQLKSDVKNGH